MRIAIPISPEVPEVPAVLVPVVLEVLDQGYTDPGLPLLRDS